MQSRDSKRINERNEEWDQRFSIEKQSLLTLKLGTKKRFLSLTAPNHDFRADKMGNDFGLLYFRVWWWWCVCVVCVRGSGGVTTVAQVAPHKHAEVISMKFYFGSRRWARECSAVAEWRWS